MSAYRVACPSCRVVLKSAKPLPVDLRVQCPQCGNHFQVPGGTNGTQPQEVEDHFTEALPQEEETPIVRPTGERKLLILALAGAILIAGAGISAAIYFTSDRNQPAAPESSPKKDGGDKLVVDKELEQKKQKDFLRLMLQGQEDLSKQRNAEAQKSFEEALALFPDDADAKKKLSEARDSSRTAGDDDKRFASLMKRGREAMDAKKFTVAVVAFDGALLVKPDDETAKRSLSEAEEAIAADAAERKKIEDYRGYLAAGRAAMQTERFADAVREYGAALRLIPDDPAAREGLQMAERARDNTVNLQTGRADVTRLMEQGKAALRDRKYDTAIRNFEDAAKLVPSDRDVRLALDDARRKRDEAKRGFDQAMSQGDLARANQRWEEALRLYLDAERMYPENDAAARARLTLQKGLDDAQAARFAYIRFMNEGTLAMVDRRYIDAVRAFGEALRLFPNDVDAAAKLQDAKVKLDLEIRKRADFDKLMQTGTTALSQRKYDQAVRAFTDALRLYPDSDDANAGLHKASYALHMNDGNNALNARRFPDAIKAFEDALKDTPGDDKASTGLKKAKYGQAMADGAAAFNAKRYKDAIAAYQEALRVMPNDLAATGALKTARDKDAGK